MPGYGERQELQTQQAIIQGRLRLSMLLMNVRISNSTLRIRDM